MKTKELKKLIEYWPDEGEVHIEGCELNEDDIWCVATAPQWHAMHVVKSDKGMIPDIDFTVYTVWKCKALQNWKYLISSTLPDGMYYELTFNGDKKEWYFDAYKKFENKVIVEK